jgi:hypothetical protein
MGKAGPLGPPRWLRLWHYLICSKQLIGGSHSSLRVALRIEYAGDVVSFVMIDPRVEFCRGSVSVARSYSLRSYPDQPLMLPDPVPLPRRAIFFVRFPF